jgi:hypothetical protein
VDERECNERDEVERDCLSFLNGRAAAFAPFCTDFLRDAAFPEMIEDLAEEVSVDFAMGKRTVFDIPLSQSNLYLARANFKYIDLFQHCDSSDQCVWVILLARVSQKLT